MASTDGDPRFDFRATLRDGYDHHAIRFGRWREEHTRVTGTGEARCVEVDGRERPDFVVTIQHVRGGGKWWHLYRRLNPNDEQKKWRWIFRAAFPEEVALYVDDVVCDRKRIGFGGIQFERKPLPPT